MLDQFRCFSYRGKLIKLNYWENNEGDKLHTLRDRHRSLEASSQLLQPDWIPYNKGWVNDVQQHSISWEHTQGVKKKEKKKKVTIELKGSL